MSSAGHCPRLLDYEFKYGKSSPDYGTAMRFQRGHNLHAMWQKIWETSELGFKDAELELTDEVSDEEDKVRITGHPDGYFEHYDAIYELKCVALSTYILVSKRRSPLEQHLEQSNYYASVYGARNILFHYFNANNGESQFFLIEVDPDLFQKSRQKFLGRATNKRKGVIAPRPYSDRTESPCWWCDHVVRCYEDQEEQVKKFKGKTIDRASQPLLYNKLLNYSAANELKNSMSRAEKDSRKQVTNYMLEKKLKNVQVGEFKLSLGFNKKKQPIAKIEESK